MRACVCMCVCVGGGGGGVCVCGGGGGVRVRACLRTLLLLGIFLVFERFLAPCFIELLMFYGYFVLFCL